MPELPEVETTLRGLKPHILHRKIQQVTVRNTQLRKPLNEEFTSQLQGSTVIDLSRRAKYLIIHLNNGYWIAHLGMSGSLSFHDPNTPYLKHDHLIITFNNTQLRYNDPRRFGFHEFTSSLSQLNYLNSLGPEPLDQQFNAETLFAKLKKTSRPIKSMIMDQKIVVGVGNIYATEALYLANIHPLTPGNKLSIPQLEKLINHIQSCLKRSIELGGTTLRDFINPDKKSGYFQQTLWVYGRLDKTCKKCQTTIESVKINQRASAYCKNCQPLEPN